MSDFRARTVSPWRAGCEKSGRIGVIMVTVATDTVDRVVGLESGADDYIPKPFEPRELLARVKSVLRRVTGVAPTTGPRVRMGRFVLDLEKRVLCNADDGSEETLAASEFDLLKAFAEIRTARSIATGCWKSPPTAKWRLSTAPSTCALRDYAVRSSPIRHIPPPFALFVAWATCSCHRTIKVTAPL